MSYGESYPEDIYDFIGGVKYITYNNYLEFLSGEMDCDLKTLASLLVSWGMCNI